MSKLAEVRSGLDWVIQRMPGAVYRCALDPEPTMVELSDRFEALTGFPAAQLIGVARGFIDLIHPDDRASVIEGMRSVVDEQTPTELEFRLLARDGTELWLRQAVWPVPEQSFVEGFIFDVTERRRLQRAEAELQLTHARQQRCLYELATHPAIAEGEFEQLSRLATQRVAELVGVERASIWLLDDGGERLELVDLFTATTRDHSGTTSLSAHDYPNYFQALHSGRSIAAHDALTDLRTAEFGEHYLQPQGIVAMLDATIRIAGRVAGVLCLEQVGPARRWLEHEIDFAGEVADQISLALLNRVRIAAQAEQDELRAQLVQSQKMDALGRLAGGVAHDFNNLLMAISGNAELLVSSLEQSEQLQSANEIVDATVRAGELVGQLLRFARREPLELRTIDLGDAVHKLEDMLRRLLDKRLRFEVQISPTPIHVRATETLVQQVLTNLVVNARDAVDEGGHIRMEVDTIDTVEPGEQPRVFARVRVIDDGAGMDPAVQAKVFEPFFTTKPAGKGTGLGLATVYSIVHRCGGSLDITSAVGQGTTVSILLPLEPG